MKIISQGGRDMAKNLAVKFGPGLLETYLVRATKPLANGVLGLELSGVLDDVKGSKAEDGFEAGKRRFSTVVPVLRFTHHLPATFDKGMVSGICVIRGMLNLRFDSILLPLDMLQDVEEALLLRSILS